MSDEMMVRAVTAGTISSVRLRIARRRPVVTRGRESSRSSGRGRSSVSVRASAVATVARGRIASGGASTADGLRLMTAGLISMPIGIADNLAAFSLSGSMPFLPFGGAGHSRIRA